MKNVVLLKNIRLTAKLLKETVESFFFCVSYQKSKNLLNLDGNLQETYRF